MEVLVKLVISKLAISGDACNPFGGSYRGLMHEHAAIWKSHWQIAEQHTVPKWPQEDGMTVAEDFVLMICGELENVQL